MQSSWNDLRYLVAIKRAQTLGAAARQLRVDDTTVSRRLAALESKLGEKLVQRRGDSRLVLTEVGERVVQCAEAMERQYQLICGLAGNRDVVGMGTVRLTAVPIIANRLLAPRVGALVDKHPGLVLELIPDSRDFNLTRREADVAVRLGRPVTGGMNIKTRRVGTLKYAVYASRSTGKAQSLPWIVYEDSMAHLPQARWMEQMAQEHGDRRSALRVHDAETALEATVAGLGRTLLPCLVADAETLIRRVELQRARPLPSREIWLLTHADQLELPRAAAVIEWIERIVGGRMQG